jgi:hypothetical protein
MTAADFSILLCILLRGVKEARLKAVKEDFIPSNPESAAIRQIEIVGLEAEIKSLVTTENRLKEEFK